ncbi:MAG: class I adenylate-forming enzyme family protein [Patulibacter sp.]
MPRTESWIERAARLHPDRIAIDAPDGTLSYAALERASWRVADQLICGGITSGMQLALTGVAGGTRFAVALHGCLRAGVVAVPIDPRLPDAQQAQRAGACDDALAVDALAPVAELTAPIPDRSRPGGRIARRSGHQRCATWTPPQAERCAPPLAGSGDDAQTPAVLLYTSGSTGPGTPVLLSRGALLWNALGSAAALGQPPGERWLSAMPVAHVGGLTVFTRSAIGVTTALVRPRFDVGEQVELLMRGDPTITSVVPTMLARLLDAGLSHPPNLRLVLLGGAPISRALVARAEAAGVPVAGTYGMTETCSQVYTAGAPLFCTDVALRSERASGAQEDELVDAADAGSERAEADDELLVRGPTLALGVAGADGWLATGDRGARRPDGTLAVIGRLTETIITGGENVAPTEIEAQLLAQPGIADAAALGVPDAEWGQRLEARVVLVPGYALDADALRATLRGVLPPFAVPKAITAVDALPRTPTGKLRRRELR